MLKLLVSSETCSKVSLFSFPSNMSISSITSSPETENSPSLYQIIKSAVDDGWYLVIVSSVSSVGLVASLFSVLLKTRNGSQRACKYTPQYLRMVDWFGELPGFLPVKASSENVPSSGCNTAICSPSLKIMLIILIHCSSYKHSSISPFKDKPKFHGVNMINFLNLQDVRHGHRDADVCWDIRPCVLVKNKRSYFPIVIALQINNNYRQSH